MNPELERLILLQRADTELRRVQAALLQVPQERQKLDQELESERTRLNAAREALSASQKARRTHEGSLTDLEGKRSKYKGQLMDVKTNKEYTAMLHEIETVERDIRGIEDQILVEMEKADGLAGEAKREETAFKEVEQRHRSEVKRLEERAASLTAEVERWKSEREAVAATIDSEVFARFERVAKKRGSAVAAARDGTCQECHVKLRPQMYVDLKRNEDITECPACNRILYYDPPVPVVVPQS
jgi:predicted  nucleic acid-binding Zn-ribbon protein